MSDHRALLLAERARPSALDLGPTLRESNPRDVEGPYCIRFGKTGAARLGVAFARRMVLPCQRRLVALFEDRLFSRLDDPLILTGILLWLFGVALWSSLSVVRHAESLAWRLGELYGTLLLTLTITSIEVVAISAVVRHGGPNPTLMRDTLLALIMIIMNGMVGATLLIGGFKH